MPTDEKLVTKSHVLTQMTQGMTNMFSVLYGLSRGISLLKACIDNKAVINKNVVCINLSLFFQTLESSCVAPKHDYTEVVMVTLK